MVGCGRAGWLRAKALFAKSQNQTVKAPCEARQLHQASLPLLQFTAVPSLDSFPGSGYPAP